jgi:hypothetical protein
MEYLMNALQDRCVSLFINTDADPAGFGTLSKRLLAVGRGKFLGKGFMTGRVSQLQFIPEHHTDFIFTVFSEEWGFIGSVVLFALFISFINRCLKIAMNAHDELGSIIAFGIAAIIWVQFTNNVMMAIHLAPVVGIPLPFVSYRRLVPPLHDDIRRTPAQHQHQEIHVLEAVSGFRFQARDKDGVSTQFRRSFRSERSTDRQFLSLILNRRLPIFLVSVFDMKPGTWNGFHKKAGVGGSLLAPVFCGVYRWAGESRPVKDSFRSSSPG